MADMETGFLFLKEIPLSWQLLRSLVCRLVKSTLRGVMEYALNPLHLDHLRLEAS